MAEQLETYFGENELCLALDTLRCKANEISFSEAPLPYIVDASYVNNRFGLIKAWLSLDHHVNRYKPELKYIVDLNFVFPKASMTRSLATGDESQVRFRLSQLCTDKNQVTSLLPDIYRSGLEHSLEWSNRKV